MRQIKVISQTGSNIITLQEAKDFMKVDYSDDDTIIGYMIAAAHDWAENYLSKDIIAKQREYYLDKTNGLFDLPFAPNASIDEVKINDVATTDYEVLGLNNETIELDAGESLKVKIKYTTLGIDASLAKQAILQLVSTYYDNRADFEVGVGVNVIPTNVKAILAPLKNLYI